MEATLKELKLINPIALLDQAEKDLEIKYDSDIGFLVSTQPSLFIKYSKMLKEQTMKLKSLQLALNELESKLWLYYTGKADPEVYKQKPLDHRFLKSEIKDAILQDKEYVIMKQKIMIQEEVVDTLERIVQQIKDRGFALKNIIEWKKFISGG